jgi:hypothetical protein
MVDDVERTDLREPAADVLLKVTSIVDALHPVVRPLDHLAWLNDMCACAPGLSVQHTYAQHISSQIVDVCWLTRLRIAPVAERLEQ